MRIKEKLREKFSRLTIRERLTYSNLLMFLIPVAITIVTSLFAFAFAFYAFEHFYLPRTGLTMKDLHAMGEQYEKDLKSFVILVAVLLLAMLTVLILSIAFTNRFLTRFMFRRVEDPLSLLTEGAAKIGEGRLENRILYDREDEFRPVFDAFNEMASRLMVSAEQAAKEEQRRRELFAGISHDLRSPLTSVRAYTEALLDGLAETPEDVRRYLEKIRVHEEEIERITDALFLYAKMQLREYPVHPQCLNLAEEVRRICQAQPSDGHLTIDFSGVPSLFVDADPLLLERILVNLLDNSRKYRRGELARVNISANRTKNGILLSVADDGIGVREELLPRLFDPFYRTDPARKSPADGSGLGLAIVREGVSRLGGEVWAENVPGGGLAIRIRLREERDDGKHSDH